MQQIRFYDDILENMKKYYEIDDHRGLIKYMRLHELEHHEHYDNIQSSISLIRQFPK